MPTRRRLGDLYVTGKQVNVNDDSGGEPIGIWMQKLNPVENEDAMRRAGASRAQHLAYSRDKDSPEWRTAETDVRDFATRDSLIDIAIRDEVRLRRTRIEAEMGDEEEWSKDDYLQSLVDAWEGTTDSTGERDSANLKARWEENPEDPEAKRVKDELDRFEAAVEKLVDDEKIALRADWQTTPEAELVETAVQHVLEQRASTAFFYEYETWQLYWSIRVLENHAKLYFESRDEVLSLATEIRDRLLEHYATLLVAPAEGKGSEGTPDSSPSSDQPEVEATGVSSGREVVSV